MQVLLPGAGGRIVLNPGTEWFTREEDQAFILQQAGHPLPVIARNLRVSVEEAELILARRRARERRMFAGGGG
ncbi:MAG TPA: hypothetical protein VF972_09270 [Actinomycetota bacterium]